MEVGSVKSTMTTYQGSGLENSAGQKTALDTKVAAVSENESEKKNDTENSPLEVEEVKDVKEMNRQESVKRAVEQINRKAKNSEAVFGIHDGTNRVTIKIVDKETKEVIREFPPEETLDMIAKVWELAGLMVDEKR